MKSASLVYTDFRFTVEDVFFLRKKKGGGAPWWCLDEVKHGVKVMGVRVRTPLPVQAARYNTYITLFTKPGLIYRAGPL